MLLVNKAYANETVTLSEPRSGTAFVLDESNWNTPPMKSAFAAGAPLSLLPFSTVVVAFDS